MATPPSTATTNGNLISTTYADGTVESLAYDPSATSQHDRPPRQAIQYTTSGRSAHDQDLPRRLQSLLRLRRPGNLTTRHRLQRHDHAQLRRADQLTQITYPSGRYLKYAYDAAGRRTRWSTRPASP